MCEDAQSRDSSSFKCHDIMLKLKIRLSCFTLKHHHARLLLNKLLTLLSCPAKGAFFDAALKSSNLSPTFELPPF